MFRHPDLSYAEIGREPNGFYCVINEHVSVEKQSREVSVVKLLCKHNQKIRNKAKDFLF